MVDKTSFKTINGATATQNFYSVVLHELTHWTGHETRCNRKAKYEGKFFSDFNSADKYAFEELVAEIGASIQCCMLGLTNEPAKHSLQYLSGWKAKLKAKPETILKASAMAQAGVRFIDNLQKKHPA
jgi:antirestriction protein ArdC